MTAGNDPIVPEGLRSRHSYLPALETLRGLAIVMVVLFHYHGILGGDRSSETPLWIRLIAAGNTGVTLFFVLSGFLLSRPFVAALNGGTPVSVVRFYRARALRILPAYLVMITIAWGMTREPSLWKALLFVPLGMKAFPFALPWWSLCTEVQFYVVLPWLMMLAAFRGGRWILAGLFCAWIGLYGWYAVGLEWPAYLRPLRNSLFGRGVGFLAGGALAWLVASPVYLRLCRLRITPWIVFAACSGLLFGLLVWYGGRSQEMALRVCPFFHDLEAVLWAGIMLAFLAGADQCMPSLMRKALDGTAVISYSLYLVHVPIQFYLLYPLIKEKGPAFHEGALWGRLVASAVVAWLVAWLGYHYVERPFLRRKAALRP